MKNSPTKITHRPCPVCGKHHAHILHHQRFTLPENHPLPDNFDVVVCDDCGFVFADTTSTAADYDRYYANYSKYADQQTSTGGGGNAKDQERLDKTASDIAAKISNKQAKIVDVGCANGGLLASLKTLGYTNLLGVDPSPDCVKNVQTLFGIPAAQGWLGALPSQAADVNVVIVSHVYEHVLDPLASTHALTAILAPGGIVYVETPNADSYVDCLASPFQDFNTEHINHFGAATLENLFSAAGYKCLGVGTKFIEAAPGVPYPAVFGFFQRPDKATKSDGAMSVKWKKEPAFYEHLDIYIQRSRDQIAVIEKQLTPILNAPLIIWGTGQLTMKLLAETKLSQVKIHALVDGNPINHGKRIRGIEIVAPEKLKTMSPHPILIGSLLHHKAISERIKTSLHLPNPVITIAL